MNFRFFINPTISVTCNPLHGFLVKSPRGVGFFFGFFSEASKNKNPTPLGLFVSFWSIILFMLHNLTLTDNN